MRTKITAITLAAALTLAIVAVSGQASAADCRVRIGLAPTAFGSALAATGSAEKRSQKNGARQTFTVEVDAAVPAGTVFAVFVNGTSLAGTITMAIPLGAVIAIGTLDLSNANGTALPTGVNPTCAVSSVLVSDGDGNILLSGSF